MLCAVLSAILVPDSAQIAPPDEDIFSTQCAVRSVCRVCAVQGAQSMSHGVCRVCAGRYTGCVQGGTEHVARRRSLHRNSIKRDPKTHKLDDFEFSVCVGKKAPRNVFFKNILVLPAALAGWLNVRVPGQRSPVRLPVGQIFLGGVLFWASFRGKMQTADEVQRAPGRLELSDVEVVQPCSRAQPTNTRFLRKSDPRI